MLDNGGSEVVEGVESLHYGLLVVVHATARLRPLQEAALHGGVFHVEVHHSIHMRHIGLEALACCGSIER